jgi:asparagine synthase (glutamine-hydrolysing)
MCGIGGFRAFDNAAQKAQALSILLSHRGPDAEGTFSDQDVWLVHRRLSILDLSQAANQPFSSSCGRYVIVFNGEIFNYQSVSSKLRLKTRTQSDTEVAVEAFAKIGLEAAGLFNGMYALCIFDKLERKFYLLRDRVGVKPLFIYQNEGLQFAFSSELGALVKGLGIRPKLNPYALANFLHLGYIPENQTIYENIHKFPSGCWGILEGEKLVLEPYWEIEKKFENQTLDDFDQAKDQLKTLLSESVRLQMISDVSVGTFLSGGVDSTLVTALAQHHSHKSLKTFTIGFKEAKHDESGYARKIASYLGTDHNLFILSQKEAMQKIAAVPEIYGQPFADSSALPTMLVSQMAAGKLKVILSGDGGDELFMGYGAYRWAEWLNSPKGKLSSPALKFVLRQIGTLRYLRIADLLDLPSKDQIPAHIFSQEQYFFSAKQIAEILHPDLPKLPTINQMPVGTKERKLTAPEQQSFFDFKNYLKDDLLVKVDIASMQYSLEVRVPLLDYRIAEFALNLNPELRKEKKLLKAVLFDFVPQAYFQRPKWGFSIPLASWLKGGLSYLIKDYLSEEVVANCGFVRYEVVLKYLKLFYSGQEHHYNRIWALIMLHKWAVETK